jgi:Domain of unknown function (DUF4118)
MDTRDIDGTSALTAGVGSMAIVLVAGLLGEARGALGPANVALAIAILVVGSAALGGRYAGVLTGVVGALSFDFFHTQPYGTLRINNAKDIETVVLLLLIGALAGELTHLRDSHRQEKAEADGLLETVLAVSHVAASGGSVDDVWQSVKEALIHELGPVDCRFEPFGTLAPPLPRIQSSGALPHSTHRRFLGHGFELPTAGAEIAVGDGTHVFGRIVVVPRQPRGVSLRERRVAVAVAEQLGIAVAHSGTQHVLN